MSEDKATKIEIRREYLAPVFKLYNNLRDYAYGFTVFKNAEVVVKQPVIFQGPELTDLPALAETPAFIFMKERYDLDAHGVFQAALGRIGTGPAYVKADSEANAEAAGKAAQVEADLFKVGVKKAAAPKVSAEQKARLNAYEQMAVEMGCVNEDGTPDMAKFDALVKAKVAKKK